MSRLEFRKDVALHIIPVVQPTTIIVHYVVVDCVLAILGSHQVMFSQID